QPPGGAREDLFEGFDNLQLRPGEPAAIDVRAVGEERHHALGAELRQTMDVEMLAVDRRLVDLEIAGMDDDADRGADGERDAIGHAVRHAGEFDVDRTDGDAIARPGGDEWPALVDTMLLELWFDQRQRQRRRVDGTIHMPKDVRDSANVVLMTVGEDERGDALPLEIGEVRDD